MWFWMQAAATCWLFLNSPLARNGPRQQYPRLQANGVDVLGPTNQTIFKSIYFFDPNAQRLELAVDVGTPEMHAKLDACKWGTLNEWAPTKRAPKHAAWMHETEMNS